MVLDLWLGQVLGCARGLDTIRVSASELKLADLFIVEVKKCQDMPWVILVTSCNTEDSVRVRDAMVRG